QLISVLENGLNQSVFRRNLPRSVRGNDFRTQARHRHRERIKPGHMQQNGRHERMHLTLKKGNNPATGLQWPAAAGTLRCLLPRVQCRRPHEAVDMKCPAELYVASPRPYDGLPELS